MKILTSYYEQESEITTDFQWGNCFHGESLDQRGSTSIDYLKKHSQNVFKVIYNHPNHLFELFHH